MKLKAAKRLIKKHGFTGENYLPSLVMIGAWRISKQLSAIAEWMKVAPDEIADVFNRLSKNGIVTSDGVNSDWSDWAVFALDLTVARGLTSKSGEVYRLTDAGQKYADELEGTNASAE